MEAIQYIVYQSDPDLALNYFKCYSETRVPSYINIVLELKD